MVRLATESGRAEPSAKAGPPDSLWVVHQLNWSSPFLLHTNHPIDRKWKIKRQRDFNGVVFINKTATLHRGS
jgi:hypothetical protein